jgi:hypothetical protein
MVPFSTVDKINEDSGSIQSFFRLRFRVGGMMDGVLMKWMAVRTIFYYTKFYLHLVNTWIMTADAGYIGRGFGRKRQSTFAIRLAMTHEAFYQLNSMLAFIPILGHLWGGFEVAIITVRHGFRAVQMFSSTANFGKGKMDKTEKDEN